MLAQGSNSLMDWWRVLRLSGAPLQGRRLTSTGSSFRGGTPVGNDCVCNMHVLNGLVEEFESSAGFS